MPDIFLKFDPAIDGGSESAKFAKHIEIESFSWGVSNAPPDAKPDTPAVPQALSVVGPIDRQSPKLFEASAKGSPFTTAQLIVVSDGQEQQAFYKLTLSEVYITSYQVSGHESSPVPSESYTLSYRAIENTFHPQKPDGTLDAPITGAYDYRTQRT